MNATAWKVVVEEDREGDYALYSIHYAIAPASMDAKTVARRWERQYGKKVVAVVEMAKPEWLKRKKEEVRKSLIEAMRFVKLEDGDNYVRIADKEPEMRQDNFTRPDGTEVTVTRVVLYVDAIKNEKNGVLEFDEPKELPVSRSLAEDIFAAMDEGDTRVVRITKTGQGLKTRYAVVPAREEDI